MNKFFTTLIAALGFSTAIFAQTPKGATEFGITAGLNTATVTSSYSSADYHAGFNAGIAVDYYFSPSWSIKGKLLYDQKGWGNGVFFTPESDIYNINYKLDYVTIPVMANWHFGRTKNWYLNFGPYLGFLVSASASGTDVKDLFNTADAGLDVGIGIKFPVFNTSKFFIEINGQGGIADVIKDNPGSALRNSVSQINVGINF